MTDPSPNGTRRAVSLARRVFFGNLTWVEVQRVDDLIHVPEIRRDILLNRRIQRLAPTSITPGNPL